MTAEGHALVRRGVRSVVLRGTLWSPSQQLLPNRLVVVDDFLDDEVKELLGERRIEVGFDRELP